MSGIAFALLELLFGCLQQIVRKQCANDLPGSTAVVKTTEGDVHGEPELLLMVCHARQVG